MSASDPRSAFQAFAARVCEDGELLFALCGHRDVDAMAAAAVERGRELGLHFGPAEVRAAWQASFLHPLGI